VFVKITDWNECIPEKVRKEESGGGGEGEEEEFMPVYPFEKVIWPKKVGSPFLEGRGGAMKGVKGPGGILNVPVGNGVNGAGGDGDNTRKKTRSPGRTQQQQQQPQPPQPQPLVTTTAMATLQTTHAAQSQNPYQHFQQPYVQQQQQQMVSQQRSTTLGPDRSIIAAAGGIAAIGGPAQVEKLPADTGKPFYHRVSFSYSGPSPLVFSFLLLTICVFFICSETIRSRSDYE
jgi:chromatin structure-remodeling complex subunit RSC1/2